MSNQHLLPAPSEGVHTADLVPRINGLSNLFGHVPTLCLFAALPFVSHLSPKKKNSISFILSTFKAAFMPRPQSFAFPTTTQGVPRDWPSGDNYCPSLPHWSFCVAGNLPHIMGRPCTYGGHFQAGRPHPNYQWLSRPSTPHLCGDANALSLCRRCASFCTFLEPLAPSICLLLPAFHHYDPLFTLFISPSNKIQTKSGRGRVGFFL